MSTRRIRTILDRMQDLFGDYPTTELNYETPFQCLIAVMMSAQTTDKQVNIVSSTLFQKVT
jgi:endonuclease-3